MVKPDFPALLQPGLHRLTIAEVHTIAVGPFPNDAQRQTLLRNLTTWMVALNASGVGGKFWMDGSFLTEKPNPDDIDCILWHPHWLDGVHNTQENQQRVQRLLDRTIAKSMFGLDLYVEYPNPDMVFHREAYWSGVLGFGHDRITAKGFAEVTL